MKKRSLLLGLLSVCVVPAFAQYGTLDNSFDSDGIVITDINNNEDDVVKKILIQPDGKIIAGGYTTSNSLKLNQICLVRYNVDGSLDNSFGTNGVVVSSFTATGSSIANAIALQSDGKIIAVGSELGIVIARYNVDGSVDNTFGVAGHVMISTSNNSAAAEAVLVQPDGKIVVGGAFLDNPPDGYANLVIRLLPDGTRDAAFGTNGIATVDVSTGAGLAGLEFLKSMALQADGKLICAGVAGPNSSLLRLKTNGTLDSTFAVNGIMLNNYSIGGNSSFNDVLLQSDGKILAVGGANSGQPDFLMARYDVNGNPDMTFGTSGVVVTAHSALQDFATSVLLQGNNNIIVGGGIVDNSVMHFALFQYDATGNIISSFGNNGVLTTKADNNYSAIASIAFQADGKIVVGGNNNSSGNKSDYILARYIPDVFPVSVSGQQTGSVSASIFPNPSQGNAIINYSLKQASDISISLYTIEGKFIKQVADPTYKISGNHQVHVDMGELPCGNYLINIATDKDAYLLKTTKE